MQTPHECGPREAAAALAKGGVLVDVRTPEEFALVHVSGAVSLPLHELEQRAEELEIPHDAPVVVMCHHGVRSMKGALALRALAAQGKAPSACANAVSIAGGMDLWSQAVDASVRRYERGPGGSRLI
jgi:rhodanese-related sulfurtransferase